MRHHVNLSFYHVFKEVARFSLPIVTTNLINVINSFISMLIIARIGVHAVAAGALIGSWFSTLFVLASAILYSTGIYIGRYIGEKKPFLIGTAVRTSLLLATGLGIVVTLLFIFSKPILLLLHQPYEIVVCVAKYFSGLSIGLLPMFWGVVVSQFFMGIGQTRIILYVSIITLVLCPTLTYLFVHGVFGYLKLDFWGAGLAISITSWLVTIGMVLLLLGKRYKEYKIFPLFIPHEEKISKSLLCGLLKLGFPISVQYGIELLAFAIVTLLMGLVGMDALSAQQIIQQLNSIFIIIIFALSQALSIMVSRAFGNQQYVAILQYTRAALILGMVIMLLSALLYWFVPDHLINVYLNVQRYPSVANLIVKLLAIVAISQFFDAARNIVTGAFRGLNKAKQPMWIGMLGLWGIGLPLAWLLGWGLSWGAIGIRIGISLGIIAASIILFFYYRRLVSTLLMETHVV